MVETRQEILKGIDETIAKYRVDLVADPLPGDSEEYTKEYRAIVRYVIADLERIKGCMLKRANN